MMWQLQVILAALLAECAAVLQTEDVQNFLFAALALWAATGRGQRWCAILTAVLHVLLILL